MSKSRRTPVPADANTKVMTSVPLDVETHAKLCGIAALDSVDRSAYAAKLIKDGLRGVILIDKRTGNSGNGNNLRAVVAPEVNDTEDEAA